MPSLPCCLRFYTESSTQIKVHLKFSVKEQTKIDGTAASRFQRLSFQSFPLVAHTPVTEAGFHSRWLQPLAGLVILTSSVDSCLYPTSMDREEMHFAMRVDLENSKSLTGLNT